MRPYFVSGASRGVGLATVQDLAARPGNLVFLGCRNLKDGQQLVTSIKTAGNSKVVAIQNDVGDDASIRQSVNDVEHELKKRGLPIALAGLVNNAGINLEFHHFIESGAFKPPTTPEGIRQVLNDTYQINVFGAAAMIVAFLPLLEAFKDDRAVVINVSSNMGAIAYHENEQNLCYAIATPGYGTSKAALNSLTMFYAKMHPSIRFAPIHPGFLGTDQSHFHEATVPVEYGGKVLVDQLLDTKGSNAFLGPEGGIGGADVPVVGMPW